MDQKSCSHWWHAPIYFTLSAALALIAITSLHPPTPTTTDTTILSSTTTPTSLSFHNASSTLRAHNFTILSALLDLSPNLLLPPSSPSATIFALPDSHLSDPSLLLLLLRYHSLPSLSLPFSSLLLLPHNSCLPSSLPNKNLSLSTILSKISHPDLFLSPHLSIHAVLSPFTSLHHSPNQSTFISYPNCSHSNSNLPSWKYLISLLSKRKNLIPFAVALNSVLRSDFPDIHSATVLAPEDFPFAASPDHVLDRAVRVHVLPDQRYSFAELKSLPEKSRLRTLVKGKVVEITSAGNGTVVGGVRVTAPDVCSTSGVVVHAIARAFAVDDYANAK